MKFKITVINTDKIFRVHVSLVDGPIGEKEIWNFGWYGGEFEHAGKRYSVIGPFHDFQENKGKYRVYELVPVSELS